MLLNDTVASFLRGRIVKRLHVVCVTYLTSHFVSEVM